MYVCMYVCALVCILAPVECVMHCRGYHSPPIAQLAVLIAQCVVFIAQHNILIAQHAVFVVVSYPATHPPAILFGQKSGSGDYLQNPW